MPNIIQIQLGRQGNEIGSHFWDTCSNYNGSNVFCIDQTPLFVSVDSLEDVASNSSTSGPLLEGKTWTGDVQVVKTPQKCLPLWSERMPRSLDTWKDAFLQVSKPGNALEDHTFAFGRHNVFEYIETDGISNKIRKLVEKCDSLGGFNILSDCSSSYGGTLSKVIENIRDEIGLATIALYDVSGDNIQPNQMETLAQLNRILCLGNVSENVSMVVDAAGKANNGSWLTTVNSFLMRFAVQGASLGFFVSSLVPMPRMKVTSMGFSENERVFASLKISRGEMDSVEVVHKHNVNATLSTIPLDTNVSLVTSNHSVKSISALLNVTSKPYYPKMMQVTQTAGSEEAEVKECINLLRNICDDYTA